MHTFIKMRIEFFKATEIPEGVEVSVNGDEVSVKGPQGEVKKDMNFANLELKQEGKTFTVGSLKATKREKKMANTIIAHVNNMIKGVQEKFEYTLKICSSHFPMTVKVEGNSAEIKNFLGEKISRRAKIPASVEVNVKGDKISVVSINKELAGQTAANFEAATKIRNRDRRIFQDGIFILNKAGKEI